MKRDIVRTRGRAPNLSFCPFSSSVVEKPFGTRSSPFASRKSLRESRFIRTSTARSLCRTFGCRRSHWVFRWTPFFTSESPTFRFTGTSSSSVVLNVYNWVPEPKWERVHLNSSLSPKGTFHSLSRGVWSRYRPR